MFDPDNPNFDAMAASADLLRKQTKEGGRQVGQPAFIRSQPGVARCGRVLWKDGQPVARCTMPWGVEHDHSACTADEAVAGGIAMALPHVTLDMARHWADSFMSSGQLSDWSVACLALLAQEVEASR